MRRIIIMVVLVLASLAHGQSYSAVMRRASVLRSSLRDGLLAEYLFAHDARDTSGNGCDGTLKNGASVTNGVLLLDGVNDWVEINYSALDVGTGSVTIAIWCNPSNAGAGDYIFLRGRAYSGGRRYAAQLYPGQSYFEVDDNTTLVKLLSPSSIITNGSYSHIVHCYESGVGMRTYVNGSLVATNSLASYGTLNDASNFGTIGARNNSVGIQGAENYFSGKIDSLRIYNYALSTNEIAQLYNEGHD